MNKRFFLTTVLSLLLLFSIAGISMAGEGYEDVTSEFSHIMASNAAYMAYYAQQDIDLGTYPYYTGEKFASKVRSGGSWDYKGVYGTTTKYTFDLKTVTGEDLGNTHYGYVGRAATFGRTLLLSAAGAYQIYSGTSYPGWYSSYFDDPLDQSWIRYGCDLWDYNSLPDYQINETNINNTEFLKIKPYVLSDSEKESIRQEFLDDVAKHQKKEKVKEQ